MEAIAHATLVQDDKTYKVSQTSVSVAFKAIAYTSLGKTFDRTIDVGE